MSFQLKLQAQISASLSTYPGMTEEALQEHVLQTMPQTIEGFDSCLFHCQVFQQEETEEEFDKWSLCLQMFGFYSSKQAFDTSLSKAQIECELIKGVYPKLAILLKQSIDFLPYLNNLIIHDFDDTPKLETTYR